VESLTVSWMKSVEDVRRCLKESLESDMLLGEPIRLRLETPGEHRCPLCA
jgi:hypothetical protein